MAKPYFKSVRDRWKLATIKAALRGVDNTDLPSVTVVIPTRDRLAFLREAVTSVVGQEYPSLQVVVVDDASTAARSEIAGSLPPDVEYIRLDQHSGLPAARNRGLAAARSEYVLFLDDDDRLSNNAISILARCLNRNRAAVAAVGRRATFGDGLPVRTTAHPLGEFETCVWMAALAGWNAYAGQSLFRTASVRQIGGWNEQLFYGLAEDQDLWLRLGPAARVGLTPRVVYENRLHDHGPRPPELPLVEEQIRWAAVRAQNLVPHAKGARAISVRQRLARADEAYVAAAYWRSMRLYLSAIRGDPAVLLSRLFRGRVATSLGKCALGIVLGPAWLQQLKSRVRAHG